MGQPARPFRELIPAASGNRAIQPMGPWVPVVLTQTQKTRLSNIIGWVQTAKENLPAINDGVVPADRIAQASALLDRMYELAVALQAQEATEPGRKAA